MKSSNVLRRVPYIEKDQKTTWTLFYIVTRSIFEVSGVLAWTGFSLYGRNELVFINRDPLT